MKTKEAIKDIIETTILNENGLRKLNGSWCYIHNLTYRKRKDKYVCSYNYKYGVCDVLENRKYSGKTEDYELDKKIVDKYIEEQNDKETKDRV